MKLVSLLEENSNLKQDALELQQALLDMGWDDVKVDNISSRDVEITARAFGASCKIIGSEWSSTNTPRATDWFFKAFSTTPEDAENLEDATKVAFRIYKCLEARKHIYDHAKIKGFTGYKRSRGPLDGDLTYAFEVWADALNAHIWAHVVFNDGTDISPSHGEPYSVNYLVSDYPEGGSDQNEYKGWAQQDLDKLARLVKERVDAFK